MNKSISEYFLRLSPQYQLFPKQLDVDLFGINPFERKREIETQLKKINNNFRSKTGEDAFKLYVTEDGKNHAGKLPDVYLKEDKRATVGVYINARKVSDGQILYVIYDYIINNFLRLNEEELALFSAKIQDQVQKVLNKSSISDFDFLKFIKDNYSGALKHDKAGEIPSNLLELMGSSDGYDIFVSNNILSDFVLEFKLLMEKTFIEEDGNMKKGGIKGFISKWVVPRLDLSDPQTLIDYLGRLAAVINKNKCHPNVINRLSVLLKGYSS